MTVPRRPPAKPAAKRPPSGRRFWLFKSEPEVFSFDDLVRARGGRTAWDGVRNYQARNFLRDDVRVGDGVLFYHSNAEPPAVAGTAVVVGAGRPDPTQFDPGSDHHDPGADPASPRWFLVDLAADERFPVPVDLPRLKGEKGLEGMELLRRGSRLSIQPVTPAQWKIVLRMGRSGAGAAPAAPKRAGRRGA